MYDPNQEPLGHRATGRALAIFFWIISALMGCLSIGAFNELARYGTVWLALVPAGVTLTFIAMGIASWMRSNKRPDD